MLTKLKPPRQTMADRRFALTLAVNYEDTDAGGVVYHGNYLGYMERARNACLRELGFTLRALQATHSALFVVTEARLKYRAPAYLDDQLEVTLQVSRLGAASVAFAQQVRRGAEILVDGDLTLALVHSQTGRVRRMPAALAAALGRYCRLRVDG